MAVRLGSASTNQILLLALKVSVLALIVFQFRSVAGMALGSSMLFFIIFTIFYARPPMGNINYLPSALALAILPFFVPVSSGAPEVALTIGWGVVLFLILATKNLILLQRWNMYRVAHFAIVGTLMLLLVEHPNFISQAVIFVALLFIFREFYIKFTNAMDERKTLIATLESFIVIEIAWIWSFLSVGVFVSTAFLTLFVFIFHDTTLQKLKGVLDKQIVMKNGIIFAILAVAIIVLSSVSRAL